MRTLSLLLVFVILIKFSELLSGCAQIMTPTGGPKDTIPPKLLSSNPPNRTTNFKGNKITIYFDEYVQLENVTQSMLVSPLPKNQPYVDYKFKTVTIKLKDTLQPNTTYAIDLGNALKDLHEGNIYKNFSYVFSTGPVIDSLTFSGKVILAETGGIDSTMEAYLYKDLTDSAVYKHKPDYVSRLNKDGQFNFKYLPAGTYKVYALKDMSGRRVYSSPLAMFAFADNDIVVSSNTPTVTLYAFAAEKEKPKLTNIIVKKSERKLRYTTTINDGQDILSDLKLEFNYPLKNFDKNKISLTDTGFKKLNPTITIDTTNKVVTISNKWVENSKYKLVIDKSFATDTTGLSLAKNDTISFRSKSEAEYGSVKMTFKNLDMKENPVVQLVLGETIKSYPLSSPELFIKLIDPGDYDIRILYDTNKNGKWDTGNFKLKKQPEKVVSIPQKLSIKANWDNEREINL